MWKGFLRDLTLGMAATNPMAWYYLSASRAETEGTQQRYVPVVLKGETSPAEHRTAA
jgi:hypothetical protein